MMLAREESDSIDNSVRGYLGQAVCGVHGIAHGAGALCTAQVSGDGSVAGDAAGRNLTYHRVDALKEVEFGRGQGHLKRNFR